MSLFAKLFHFSQWFIAYRRQKPFSVPFDASGFQIIHPPAGHFFADPFVIEDGGKNYIFFEDYVAAKDKGVIGFVELDGQGGCSAPRVVLEKAYHLSYPFLFRVDGRIYLIPETGENRTVELYSTDNFPYDWQLVKIMLAGRRTVDATVLPHAGQYWLFATVLADDDVYGKGELYLYHADNVLADWHAHPGNPVSTDLANSRPAGGIFAENGRLIRPSQYFGDRYGEGVVFNEIVALTGQEYRERKLTEVGPHWRENNKAFHTYNRNGWFEVVDGVMVRTDWLKAPRRAVSILYRWFSGPARP